MGGKVWATNQIGASSNSQFEGTENEQHFREVALSSVRMLPPRTLFSPFVPLLCITIAAGQSVKETSVPLGDALDRALKTSSLTGPESKPFHLKVRLFESTNPPSDYRAEIEEYWVSPQQWRRTIEAPQFKQLIIVNGVQTSEQNTGDYYPLWLRNFVKGIFDPVPQSNMWNGAKTIANRHGKWSAH